jgi:hypothetical protein
LWLTKKLPVERAQVGNLWIMMQQKLLKVTTGEKGEFRGKDDWENAWDVVAFPFIADPVSTRNSRGWPFAAGDNKREKIEN